MSRILDRILRRLLPEEFADDLVGDLREGYARRSAEGRIGAAAWWIREVAALPVAALRRQARRLRASGVRREMNWRGGGGIMAGLGLGVAARALLKRPSYTAVSVLTLVASVGAATLVFSVLEGVVLRPLPYPDGERLYRVHGTNRSWLDAEDELFRRAWDRQNISRTMLAAWRDGAPAVTSVAAYAASRVRWDDGEAPVEAEGAWILPGFFSTLRLDPLQGRLPTADEFAAGEPVVVIGESLWTTRYGRDPEVLGRTVALDGRSSTVVGVMPRALAIPGDDAAWWAPLPERYGEGRMDFAVFGAIARLASGADVVGTTEQLESAVRSLAEEDAQYANLGARLVPLRDEVVSSVKGGITFVFWMVVVVTLIACVNLTSLVVARAARRRPELAMRAALGGGRASLVGAMLGETALICGLGGGLGVLASALAVGPLTRFLAATTPGFPRLDNIGIHLPVLGFSLGLTVVTALLAGAIPAWVASNRAPWEAMQEGRRSRGGRGVRRTHRTLLVLEAALAMALLVAAGLLTRSSLWVSSVDPGFEGGAAYLWARPSAERYETPEEAQNLVGEVVQRVAGLHGVEVVGRASALPSAGGTSLGLVWGESGSMERGTMVPSVAADSGYFRALGIPVLSGRAFTSADRADGEPVVVVSQALALRIFGEQGAVGRTLMIGTGTTIQGGRVVADESVAARVVGVAGDVRQLALIMDPDPVLYRPLAQAGTREQFVILRTARDAEALVGPARAAAHEVDAGLLISDAGVVRVAALKVLGPLRARTALVVALAGLAAFLTLVGIFGVVAYVVSDRTHEIGVRMALGARAAGESARMVGDALRPVTLGAFTGLAAAAALSGVLERESVLFGVGRLDVVTYASVLALLLATAVLSAWLPARRAATVDPVRVLNDE